MPKSSSTTDPNSAAPQPHRYDALGEAVYVGDIVAYTGGTGSRMRFGKIIALTGQGVRLYNFTEGGNPRAVREYNQRPVAAQLVKKQDQILLIRGNDNYKNVPGSLLKDLFPNNH